MNKSGVNFSSFYAVTFSIFDRDLVNFETVITGK